MKINAQRLLPSSQRVERDWLPSAWAHCGTEFVAISQFHSQAEPSRLLQILTNVSRNICINYQIGF